MKTTKEEIIFNLDAAIEPRAILFAKRYLKIHGKENVDHEGYAFSMATAIVRESKNQWISVDDRLPTEGGKYLISDKSFSDSDVHYWDKELKFFVDCDHAMKNDDVTHWAYMPKTPKDK